MGDGRAELRGGGKRRKAEIATWQGSKYGRKAEKVIMLIRKNSNVKEREGIC